ncbi:MAG: hypothetical protein V3V75_11250 [Thermoguttaceae bacterium]
MKAKGAYYQQTPCGVNISFPIQGGACMLAYIAHNRGKRLPWTSPPGQEDKERKDPGGTQWQQ